MSPTTTTKTTTTTTRKRKSDTGPTAAAQKKAKLAAQAHAETVNNILSDASNFEIPNTDQATRDLIVGLAQYARGLEQEVESYKPKAKSPAELDAAAQKLGAAAKSGIKKQMTWKPTCKQGSAKWTYDGVCSDPEIFGKLMGLDGPPTFKAKKVTADEFKELLDDDMSTSARYSYLRLTSDINVRWNPTEGTFKFSGTYGV